jgi:hypothetical protein
MMRTLSTTAAAAVAARTGTSLQRWLSIDWGGATGVLYYSDEPRATPDDYQDAAAVVVQWGEFSRSVRPGELGGFGETTLVLADPTGVLGTAINTRPGIQGRVAEISLSFPGQVWADRIVLARGTLAAPKWSSETRLWSFTFRSLEHHYGKQIGFRLDRNDFADVACSAQEGKILPIAFGDPVLRVPAVLVDRPGHAMLSAEFNIHDTTLTIDRTIEDGLFVRDNLFKQFYLGWPNNFETITARFTGVLDETMTLSVSSREFVDASGNSPGVFASGGLRFQQIERWKVPDWETPRTNHAVWWYIAGAWHMTTVTMWKLVGTYILIGYEGSLTISTGTPWKMAKYPGLVPIWPQGTPIHEAGTWKYVCNAVPSKEVTNVQAPAQVPVAGGGTPGVTWFDFDPEYWSAQLDDRTWNEQLGRTPDPDGDPGVTSIYLDRPPTALGFSEDTVYVTLHGPQIDPEDEDSDSLDNAPAIIERLMTDAALGAAPAEHVNSTEIAATKAWLLANRNIKTAIAITEAASLADIIAEIAYAATCAAFFDFGQLVVLPWPEFDDTAVATFTQSNVTSRALSITYHPLSDLPTIVLFDWHPYPTAETYRYVRRSVQAVADVGRHEKTIELKHIQRPTSVALAADFWAAYWVNRQATVSVGDAFLDSLPVRCTDPVRVLWTRPGASAVVDDTGIVIGIRHQIADLKNRQPDALEFEVELNLIAYTIETVSVSDFVCDSSVGYHPNPSPNFGWPSSEGETPPTGVGEASDAAS